MSTFKCERAEDRGRRTELQTQEDGGPKIQDRGQRTEVPSLKTEGRRQRMAPFRLPSSVFRLPSSVFRLPSSVFRLPSFSESAAKGFRFLHHGPEHSTNIPTDFEKMGAFFRRQIRALESGLNPMLCFGLFAIRIGKFADKVKRVSALLPGLGNVGPNRSSRTANLICQ